VLESISASGSYCAGKEFILTRSFCEDNVDPFAGPVLSRLADDSPIPNICWVFVGQDLYPACRRIDISRSLPKNGELDMLTRREFGKVGVAAAALVGSTGMIGQSQPSSHQECTHPRRVGRRRHGAYWGHGFEKIDLLSGNLCFALPLILARSRSAGAVITLSYNSQLSVGNTSGTEWAGVDVGFGFGWNLRIGLIVPQVVNGVISGYTYVDGSGAEYVLTASGETWISLNGEYLTWDPASATLKFASGKSLLFGCTSGKGEPDAGSMHPTLIQDSNGNQIAIQYQSGLSSTKPNSSCRILNVSDARSPFSTDGVQSYVFTYGIGPLPRLLSISSGLPTSESYNFLYTEQNISSPYADGGADRKTVHTLVSVEATSGRTSSYEYDSYGELTKAVLGDGGILAWEYSTAQFASGIMIREVSGRTAQASPESANQRHIFSRDISGANIHSTVTLTEHNQTSTRVWTFNSDSQSPGCGLVASVASYSGARLLRQEIMSWSKTTAGADYLGLHTKILDPGSSTQQVSRVSSSRDRFGNLLTQTLYGYDDPDAPFKTVTHTYLNDQSYIDRHILNRPLTKKVIGRQDSVALTENKYDTTPLISCDGISHHNLAAFSTANTIRGNRTEQVAGGVLHFFYYDQTGTVRSVEGSSGSSTVYAMAAGTNNTQVGTIAPNGNTDYARAIAYSTEGLPVSSRGPNGAQVSYTHDNLGRLKTITSPTGTVSTVVYEHSPTATTKSEAGRWTKQTRDGFGRVIKTEHGDATGTLSVLNFEYSPVPHTSIGALTRVSLPHAPGDDPIWIHRDYDDLGRLKAHDSSTAAGAKTIEHAGNSKVVRDAAGRWKKLVHDAQGKLVKVVLPSPDGDADQETEYRYDTLGRLSSVVMPRTNGVQRRTFKYDAGGRPVFRHHAESGPQKMTYNSDGTLASKIDAKGQREVFSRDSYKRITAVTRYDAKGVVQPNETVSYFYDTNPFDTGFSQNATGRLSAVRWGSVSTLPGMLTEMYSYTPSGRVVAQRLRLNRGQNDVDLDMTCSYDEENRLSTLIYPAGGPSLQHTYDSLGQLVGIKSSENQVVKDVTYDAVGNLLGLKLLASADGQYMAESRKYDERSRLTELVTGPSEGELSDRRVPKVNLKYDYRDTDGLLHAETDHVEGVSTSYNYDIQNRLASAQSNDGSWGLAFKYDGFGNRMSQTVTQGTAFENHFEHDPATNWMLNDDTSYDANGNIISLPYLGIEYDTQNRVKHLTYSLGGSESYAYDPRNLRVWVKTTTWGEQFYFYAGNKVLALYNLTIDSSGTLAATFKSANIYFGSRIVKSRGDAVVIDRLGATRAWSGKDGAKVTKYLPFGEELKSTSENLAKFGGYQRDSSGLDYAQNRYYASALGRFITPDPYEKSASAANPNSWNRYAFVKNDPINRVDADGLNDTILQVGHVYEVPNGNGATVEVTGDGTGTEYLPDGTSQAVTITDYNVATNVTELVTVTNSDGSLTAYDVTVTGTPTLSEQDQAIYNMSVLINNDVTPWESVGCNVGMGVGLAGAGMFFLPEAVTAGAIAGGLGYAGVGTIVTMQICP
jgi:RHS repeat-associated protein